MLRAHNPLLFLKAQGPFGPSKSLSNILRFVFSERDETPQLKHDLRSDFNLTNSPLVVGEKLRWAMDFDKNIFSEKRYEILRTKISSESLRSANDPLNISGVSEFLAESDRIVESMERSPIGMILLRQSQVSTLLDSLKQPSLGRLLKGVGRR